MYIHVVYHSNSSQASHSHLFSGYNVSCHYCMSETGFEVAGKQYTVTV